MRRRVMFAASWYFACDALRQRISRQYLRYPTRMLYGAANLVNDSVETLRSGARVPQFGRVHAVAPQVSFRLPQHPRKTARIWWLNWPAATAVNLSKWAASAVLKTQRKRFSCGDRTAFPPFLMSAGWSV